ncbi:unnamed protein product [Lupinus luteus]|uniref:BED-type domain-containing protein n=1 Tax=Lupinus luteus TaxID=3873 RepID=A0AAV1X7D0_LUPLU
MSSQGQTSSSTARVRDVGWKYCTPLTEKDTNNVVCNFCSNIYRGGITRLKNHLMGRSGNVKTCPQCPKEVREELWAIFNEKHNKDVATYERVQDARDILGDSDEERALNVGLQETTETASSITVRKIKGPIDLFFRKPESASKKEKLRQANIKEAIDKKVVRRVHQIIAQFWYQAGLPFHLVKLDSFRQMLEAIGKFGPYLPPPTYYAMRVPLLQLEVNYTEDLMKDHKMQWERFGCSIMSDAWTDRKQRCIINFLVNSTAGTMFIKSVDGSDFVKTGDKIFELLDAVVEEVGEENVMQIITNNGSNYVLAGKMLEMKRPKIYWTPCAAHCIDLMLEDIGKIPRIKMTIKRAISLVGFIYSHSSTLSLMRHFTKKRELVKHAVTRFATSFLSLEILYEEKTNLRKMFVSDEWTINKLSKEIKGKEATKIVLMPSFWKNVAYTMKVMGPLVKVLRLVDSEKKAAMGYIYEAMDKAKEAIIKAFNEKENKYKDVFKIIDERWNCQLHRPLHAAGHMLNPEYYYANRSMEFDLEVIGGLHACLHKFALNTQIEFMMLKEMQAYKDASGIFGSSTAIAMRTEMAPVGLYKTC